MRPILAVDWGTKRVGLAVSDPTRTLARPLPTVKVNTDREGLEGVLAAARDADAATILLGLPLHMDGEEGVSAEHVRRWGDSLKTSGFEVVYADERLTSEDALAFLRDQGERRPPKERVDQIAAVMLLQTYLDEGSGGQRRA